MVTGTNDQETAIAAITQGHILRFLSKPVQPRLLTRTVEDTSFKVNVKRGHVPEHRYAHRHTAELRERQLHPRSRMLGESSGIQLRARSATPAMCRVPTRRPQPQGISQKSQPQPRAASSTTMPP